MVVRCQCVSEMMKDSHGETVTLPLKEARVLEKVGQVKIIGDREGMSLSVFPKEMKEDGYLKRVEFDGRGTLTRVAWIQDYRKNGGAELSNFLVVKIGHQCGFDIIGVTPENSNMDLIRKANVIIVNNCHEFVDSQFQRLLAAIYESGKPVVKYEHDHREIQRKNIGDRMFRQSKLNVFISPLQMKNHVDAFPGIEDHSICLPLAVDPESFLLSTSGKPGSVLVPSYNKGRSEMSKFIIDNPQYEYVVIGNSEFTSMGNVSSKFEMSYIEIIREYGKHEFVLHKPDKVGGGERVYFEALLSGCKLLTNDNVAHVSWGFDEPTARKELRIAPYTFWRRISDLV